MRLPSALAQKRGLYRCRSRLFSLAFITLSLVIAISSRADDSDPQEFVFNGPEIFPIDDGITHIRAADLNGDGLSDLVVANNARSKITLLINQTGTDLKDRREGFLQRHINALPPDARFRIESIASEKRIASLVVSDLNGDDRPDIAYFGEPKELVVQFHEDKGWSSPRRWPINDGLLNPNSLVHGDINGDGRQDLLLLGEGHLYWLAQREDQTLAEPKRIPYSGSVQAVQVLDIQGDGRDDVLFVAWDSPSPFRFRLQEESGQLGPEIHFTLPPIRSYWADDLDQDHKTEVITIAQKSGRAQLSHFALNDPEPLSDPWSIGQFQILPLSKTTKARRGMVWADVNQDKLPDLLIAEPDSGQLTLYLQSDSGSLLPPTTFATLTGITELTVRDWNGDGQAEIFLLSANERQLGVSQLDQSGRIPFPTILPITGRPLVMATGSLKKDDPARLAVIVDQDGRELQIRAEDQIVHRQKLDKDFKSNPVSLQIHDLDQDGLQDLVVLIPYEKIKVLRQRQDGSFDEHDVAPPGGIIDQPWSAAADVDGNGHPEFLLAQRNFLRAVVLEQVQLPTAQPDKEEDSTDNNTERWTFVVKEQINGAGSNSRIVAATALPSKDGREPALFLLDADRRALTLTEKDEAGVWQVVRNIPLPESSFSKLQTITTGQDGHSAIAFLGLNSIAWLSLTGQVWDFIELDGYETPVFDGYLTDVVSGDLNNDKIKDLVFLETGKSHLDIVKYQNSELVPAIRWQVFEERTFRSRRNDRPEPREAIVTDVTGDGRNDLVIVVHDRILLYPQE